MTAREVTALDGSGASREVPAGINDAERELLLEILEKADLTIWAADNADSDYAIRLWGQGAERIYGFTPAEALGENYLTLFVRSGDRAEAVESHHQIVTKDRRYQWNFAAEDVSKDGSTHTILGNAFRVWDRVNQRYIYAEVGIDIADLGELGQQSARSRHLPFPHGDTRQQLKIVRGLAALNDAIATLHQPDERGLDRVVAAIRDGMHLMLSSNPLCRVWMLDDAETPRLARGSDDLPGAPGVAEEDLIGVTNLEVVQAAGPVVGEGENTYHSVVAVPLQFGPEPQAVLVMFFRNSTPFNEEDRELVRHFSSYAAVAVAMAGMAREQQRQRHRETERSRHLMIQSVLHTVGNEIGLAKLAADSLAERLGELGSLSPGTRRDLDQIQSSADRLVQLMTELMRQDTDASVHAVLRVVDAVRAVTRAVEHDYYDRVITHHKIDLGLYIRASEYLFRGAIGNLVSNAVQAMIEADGGGELRLSATEVERDWNGHTRRVIVIEIADSGPGVQPSFRERIWEPGFSTRGRGHGHGLSYTQGLVTTLGGAVKLSEEPSDLGGASFLVFIPAATRAT